MRSPIFAGSTSLRTRTFRPPIRSGRLASLVRKSMAHRSGSGREMDSIRHADVVFRANENVKKGEGSGAV